MRAGKKKAKGILSLLLALMMIISAVPLSSISVFAAESEDFEYQVFEDSVAQADEPAITQDAAYEDDAQETKEWEVVEVESGDFKGIILENGTVRIERYNGTATDVVIPSEIEGYKVTEIGGSTFNHNTTLISITIPEGVVTIGMDAFYGCTSLKRVTIPNSVKVIQSYAFAECTSLASVEIPDSVTSIGWYAFGGCTALENIKLSENITTIESMTFSDCISLKEINLPESITEIGGGVFSGCTSLASVEIPDSVTSIGWYAFGGCTALESIKLSESITEIGEGVFSGCTSLKNITIPENVSQIDNTAFIGCTSLTDIGVISENDFYSDIDGVLFNKDKTNLVIYPEGLKGEYTVPEGTLSVNDTAFNNKIYLTKINIPSTVKNLGNEPFKGCSALESINVDANNSNYSSDNGALLTKDKNSVIDYPDAKGASYNIPTTVKQIGKYAFADSALESVVIPDSVTEIGYGAFAECAALSDIDIADNVEFIEAQAFSGTAYYSNLNNWENGILYVGKYLVDVRYVLFGGDNYISAPVTIREDTKVIADEAFADIVIDAEEDFDIVIPDSVVTIGNNAFESLMSLHGINIIVPVGVKNLGTGVFRANSLSGSSYYKSSLRSVTFLGDVKNVDENMFDGCQVLKTVKFLGNVENIENRAFSNLPYLDEVSFSKSVGQIGGQAFINCESLTSVMIPDSVADIGDYAFGYTGNPGTVTNPVPGFKIYGYSGTAAETYADENGFEFIALAKTVDESTGISVAEKELDILPDGAQLKAEQLSADNNKIVFDISLIKDGAAAHPNGEVTVKIPVPEGMDGSRLKVYREEANGTFTDMNAYFADGYMVFTTDHFSKYILSAEEPSAALKGDVNGDGAVDAADAVLVQRYDAGMIALGDTQLEAADVNSDGIADAADAVIIMRYDAGLIDRL